MIYSVRGVRGGLSVKRLNASMSSVGGVPASAVRAWVVEKKRGGLTKLSCQSLRLLQNATGRESPQKPFDELR